MKNKKLIAIRFTANEGETLVNFVRGEDEQHSYNFEWVTYSSYQRLLNFKAAHQPTDIYIDYMGIEVTYELS